MPGPEKELKSHVVRHFRQQIDEGHIYETPEKAQAAIDREKKKILDDGGTDELKEHRWVIEEKVTRRPNMHSVLLKTAVNLRFGLVEGESQIEAMDRIQSIMDGHHLHRLFEDKSKHFFSIDPTDEVTVEYIEWAEDHHEALVDQENGELDDFKGSRYYQYWNGSWYRHPNLSYDDFITLMECARCALSFHRKPTQDIVDLSTEELDRIHNVALKILEGEYEDRNENV